MGENGARWIGDEAIVASDSVQKTILSYHRVNKCISDLNISLETDQPLHK